jgi:hypothetical protein
MNEAITDIIEAFADGEAVNPADLRRALADAAGREHLIDVLALRSLVGGESGVRPIVSAAPLAPAPRLAWSRWIPAAAAVLLIGGITGYLAGSRGPSGVPGEAENTVSAPAPTQVIQLRQGVDWTERAGGH